MTSICVIGSASNPPSSRGDFSRNSPASCSARQAGSGQRPDALRLVGARHAASLRSPSIAARSCARSSSRSVAVAMRHAAEEVAHERLHGVELLPLRDVPGALDDLHPRARDPRRELLRVHGRDEPVLVAPDDERLRRDAVDALLQALVRDRPDELAGRPQRPDGVRERDRERAGSSGMTRNSWTGRRRGRRTASSPARPATSPCSRRPARRRATARSGRAARASAPRAPVRARARTPPSRRTSVPTTRHVARDRARRAARRRSSTRSQRSSTRVDRLAGRRAGARVIGRVDRVLLGEAVEELVPARAAGGVEVDERRAAPRRPSPWPRSRSA